MNSYFKVNKQWTFIKQYVIDIEDINILIIIIIIIIIIVIIIITTIIIIIIIMMMIIIIILMHYHVGSISLNICFAEKNIVVKHFHLRRYVGCK